MSAPVASETRSPFKASREISACSARQAEPGGDQQGTEFVAIQGDGMGLVVHPRPAHVRGRRGAEESSSTATVEPGDGGQPPGDRGAGPALRSPGPGRSLRCPRGGRRTGQGQGPGAAGELAQVQRVGLAGQAAVAGQEPGEGDSLSVREGRAGSWRARRMGRQWSSGTSRPGWNREAGPVPVPAVQRNPNVSRLATSRYTGKERAALAWQTAREILHNANRVVPRGWPRLGPFGCARDRVKGRSHA